MPLQLARWCVQCQHVLQLDRPEVRAALEVARSAVALDARVAENLM
jgi:hypothetical protein